MPTLFLFVVFGLVVLLVGEMVAARLWFGPYYVYGIPILRRVVPVPRKEQGIPEPDVLRGRLEGQKRRVTFHPLSDGCMAFREKPWSFFSSSSSQVLHGNLRFDSETSTVIVTGNLDWSILVFAVIAVLIAVTERNFIFGGFLCIFIFSTYQSQERTYSLVAQVAAEAWGGGPSTPTGVGI
jgi:hypothetical protein